MTHKSDIWPGDPGYQINVQKIQAAISDMATVTVRGGGQYTQVSTRVEAFRRHVGANVSIETDLVVDDGKRVVIKALVRRPDGFTIATGYAEEIRGSSNVNQGAAIENCESSAIGRALAALGLHGGQYASAEEIEKHGRNVRNASAQATAEPAAPPVEDVPFDTDDWAAWVREQCNQVKGITQMSKLEAWKRSTARTRTDLERASKGQWNILAKEYTNIYQQLNTGERNG